MNIQQVASTVAEWMEGELQRFTANEASVISMICWSLWKNRNKIMWKQKGKEPKRVVESVILILNQWKGWCTRQVIRFYFFWVYDSIRHR